MQNPCGAAAKKEVSGLEIVAPIRTLDETRVTIPYPDVKNPVVLRKQKDILVADANYFDLIGYTWLAGSPATATREPYQVVLTEKNVPAFISANTKYTDIIGKSRQRFR